MRHFLSCRFPLVGLLALVIPFLLVACGPQEEGDLLATPTPAGRPPVATGGAAEPGVRDTSAVEPTATTYQAVPSTGSAPEDKAALAAVYDALGERPGWADDDRLLNDVPPLERFGVMTDDNSHVIGLLFSNSRLSGEIAPELGNLTALRWLDLSNSRLSGEIPPELGNLVNLEGLLLGVNLLTGEIPADLGNLARLQELDLSSNQLTGDIPPELGQLSNLEGLSLADNLLTGVIPAGLGNLASLGELDLSYNQLNGELPADLETWPACAGWICAAMISG